MASSSSKFVSTVDRSKCFLRSSFRRGQARIGQLGDRPCTFTSITFSTQSLPNVCYETTTCPFRSVQRVHLTYFAKISMMKVKLLLPLFALVAAASCEVSHILTTSTPPPPPHPYAFGYAAGRYPGHIDRTHSEVSDGSGVVKGTYSYVDPKFRIRTVEYVADKDGFHPILNFSPAPLPSDTAAVAAARENHLLQYNSIAQSHQGGSPGAVLLPGQTAAVQRATIKHLDLYERIAAEHAHLAAEAEAAKLQQQQLHQ